MVKMHDLRLSKGDVAAEKKALGTDRKGEPSTSVYVPPEDEGARMEFEHHHLEKMGIGGALKSGDTLHFHGHGTVEKSESRSSPDGDRHSATVRFHHGGVEHDGDEAEGKKGLREDLMQAHGKAAEKAGLKSAKGDRKIPEKDGAK